METTAAPRSVASGHQPVWPAEPPTTAVRTTNMTTRARPTPRTVATSRSRSSSVGHIHVYSPTLPLSADGANFTTELLQFAAGWGGRIGRCRAGARIRAHSGESSQALDRGRLMGQVGT